MHRHATLGFGFSVAPGPNGKGLWACEHLRRLESGLFFLFAQC